MELLSPQLQALFKGDQGLYPEYSYVSGREYRKDAVVPLAGTLWIALRNTFQTPSDSATDWAPWLRLTVSDMDVLQRTLNLSDVDDPVAARNNIGAIGWLELASAEINGGSY